MNFWTRVFDGTIARTAAAIMLAALLSVTGLCWSPAAAFADEGTVTIYQQSNPDAHYYAYGLFTAQVDANNRAVSDTISWGGGVDQDAVKAFLQGEGLSADASLPETVEFITARINSSAGNLAKGADADSFANRFAGVVKENVTPSSTIAKQGEPYTNEKGFYLFLSKESADQVAGDVATAPIWFPLGGASSYIDAKTGPATLTKQVRESAADEWGSATDAEAGETVEFRVTALIPSNYASFASFAFAINDQLPSTLMLDASSVKVFVDGVAATEFAVTAEDNALTVQGPAEGSDVKGIASIKGGSVVSVEYAAVVTGGCSYSSVN